MSPASSPAVSRRASASTSSGAATPSSGPGAWRRLAADFGLTGAECRVALLLGEGLSQRQVAARIGVSRNTVKTQAQAVYQKLGVARQAELVLLVIRL